MKLLERWRINRAIARERRYLRDSKDRNLDLACDLLRACCSAGDYKGYDITARAAVHLAAQRFGSVPPSPVESLLVSGEFLRVMSWRLLDAIFLCDHYWVADETTNHCPKCGISL